MHSSNQSQEPTPLAERSTTLRFRSGMGFRTMHLVKSMTKLPFKSHHLIFAYIYICKNHHLIFAYIYIYIYIYIYKLLSTRIYSYKQNKQFYLVLTFKFMDTLIHAPIHLCKRKCTHQFARNTNKVLRKGIFPFL